jgi:hypothetical protein
MKKQKKPAYQRDDRIRCGYLTAYDYACYMSTEQANGVFGPIYTHVMNRNLVEESIRTAVRLENEGV